MDSSPLSREPGAPSAVHELKTLVLSYHPIIVIETVEEKRVEAVIKSVAANLKWHFFEWTLTRGLIKSAESGRHHNTTDPFHALRHIETLTLDAVYLMKDFARHLHMPRVVRMLREVAQGFSQKNSALVLTGESVELPQEIGHKAVFYPFELPGRMELADVVKKVVESVKLSRSVRIDLKSGDLEELVRSLRGMTLNQARQVVAYCLLEDGVLSSSDIQQIIERKVQVIREGGLLEYFPAADNRFRLGGFARLKSWLERARIGFTAQAHALNLAAPKGILIVGIQGCGKSLAAKVVAREWGLPLLKLDAARLFDKYIGESEKNFRKAIAMAESMAPAVLWIDEIEKGLAPATTGGADGGLSRRLFGSFLTWLQEKKLAVFVVATANELSLLPPELLRKGRFDEIFFVDLPDPEERDAIFDIHMKLHNQTWNDFDRSKIITASEGFSGAEIEQAVIAALYAALHGKRALDTELLVTTMKATLPLSISRAEDVGKLRAMASERFVNVR